MHTVQLGSGDSWLRLSPDYSPLSPPEYVVAELHGEGLTATRRVVNNYASGFSDLAAFFDQLVEEWRGWSDERAWESIEHDLRIEARHQHQHVQLRVTVRSYGPGWGNEGWNATADITMEPGEELSRAASELGLLARGFDG